MSDNYHKSIVTMAISAAAEIAGELVEKHKLVDISKENYNTEILKIAELLILVRTSGK